jgi:hypothetical protein
MVRTAPCHGAYGGSIPLGTASNMSIRKWTDEDLIAAVKNSSSMIEVIQKLGLKSKGTSNYKNVNKYIQILNLDVSHFVVDVNRQVPSYKYKLEDILVKNSVYLNTSNLKRKLLTNKCLRDSCYECSISEWKGKKLSLQLDHINGDSSDNRIENLRLLCPNCHSLTSTYCRSNK